MADYSREIARDALDLGAIKLNPSNPFQWASGFRMPIYNDNRMFLFNSDYRNFIANAFVGAVEPTIPNCEIVIAGTSTAGIPWASLVADRLGRPMIYIRDKPKDHGLKNQIEGIGAETDLRGRKVVVIEDLISTGGSSAAAVQAVRDANGECNHCFSLFNYGFDEAREMFQGHMAFDKEGTKVLNPACDVKSLLTYDVLLEVAQETGYLSSDQVKVLAEWRADPFGWGEKRGFPRIIKEKK